ncbi:hypothetical protein Tco_0185184 [Tanacetum coccineum]
MPGGDSSKNSRPLKKRAEEVNDADNKSSKDENPTSIERVVESAINHLTGKWLRSRKYAAIRLPKARALLTRAMEDGNFDKFIDSRSPRD